MKLTLGQAAKHAGRAKGTLSKALNNGQITGEKDGKGRWQIDPSELQRWMDVNPLPQPLEIDSTTPSETPKSTSGNSALEVEVKMLREKIDDLNLERDRERKTLVDQIDELKASAERQSADHRQALALLSDQREKPPKGIWARLRGA